MLFGWTGTDTQGAMVFVNGRFYVGSPCKSSAMQYQHTHARWLDTSGYVRSRYSSDILFVRPRRSIFKA